MNHLKLGAVFPDVAFTEPELVPELHLWALSVTLGESGAAHVVGTSIILDGNGQPTENRIVLRFAVQASIVEAFKIWAGQERPHNQPDRDQPDEEKRERRNHH